MDQKTKEQSEQPRRPRRRGELDDRYGEIGISAVAGAVCRKAEQRRPQPESRFAPDRAHRD